MATGVGWRSASRASLVLLVWTALCAPAAGEYRTVDVESLKITFDSDWGARTAPGYLPVRLDVTNLGDARTIEFVARGTRFIRGGRAYWQGRIAARQVLPLARGDRVRLTVPVPVFGDSENLTFEIREEGRTIERFGHAGLSSRNPPDSAAALIIADMASAFGKASAGWPRPSFTSRPGRSVAGAPRALDFTLHPARVPDTWLGFTTLRAVILGPVEWEVLTPAQQEALLTWTACGGDLILVDGMVDALFSERLVSTRWAGRSVGGYFLGRIHQASSADIEAAGLAETLNKTTALQDSNWALPVNRARDWASLGPRGFRVPIPGAGAVPARAYLAILMVFSVVIGPLNYWFLRRTRQQVLLVLTTPLISAVFIVLLAGYVMAGEGVGVRARAVTFTMLDQARKQAVTRASFSLYAAGMAPRGGLRFARDEAVFAIAADGVGTREPMTLDLTDSQRFSEGLLQARAPSNLDVIGWRAARERVGFTRETGGIGVTNGLGVRIVALVYRDGGTVYMLGAPVAAGARGLLQAGMPRGTEIVPSALPWSARLEHLFEHVPAGAYLAVVDRSPFWNPGVSRVEERDSFHVVFGWVEGQP